MIEDYYNNIFILKTRTTSTGWGSEPSLSTGTAYTGAVNPARGSERLSADKQYTFADYKLFCASTVPVTNDSIIEYQSNNYTVQFVKDTFSMGHHKLVFLKSDSV